MFCALLTSDRSSPNKLSTEGRPYVPISSLRHDDPHCEQENASRRDELTGRHRRRTQKASHSKKQARTLEMTRRSA